MEHYLVGVRDFIRRCRKHCNCPLLAVLDDGLAHPLRWPPGLVPPEVAATKVEDFLRLCPHWRILMLPKGFEIVAVGKGRQAVTRTADCHSDVVFDNDEILLPGENGCLASFLGLIGEASRHKAYIVKPHDDPMASLVPSATNSHGIAPFPIRNPAELPAGFWEGHYFLLPPWLKVHADTSPQTVKRKRDADDPQAGGAASSSGQTPVIPVAPRPPARTRGVVTVSPQLQQMREERIAMVANIEDVLNNHPALSVTEKQFLTSHLHMLLTYP